MCPSDRRERASEVRRCNAPSGVDFARGRPCARRRARGAVVRAPGRQAQKHAVQHASAQPAKTAMPAKEPSTSTRRPGNSWLLPGIGEAYSQKIIEGRPYKAKSDLKSRKVIPDKVYEQISKLVVARQAPK